MLQAKPTAATYALQDPAAVSQFLSQLVAWGRTAANDWQACGGCNGWELDRSQCASHSSASEDHCNGSAAQEGTASGHLTSSNGSWGADQATTSGGPDPPRNDWENTHGGERGAAHGNRSRADGEAASGQSQSAMLVHEAHEALRRHMQQPQPEKAELQGRRGSGEGQRRRADWAWEKPLDTWYEAGPKKGQNGRLEPPGHHQ